MSMFHELMMRKKQENFLYPVIHGSLTESPEGVFSGFSSTNYLQLDNVLHETEIVVKFTTSSDITSRQLVISSARLIEISVWDSYIKTWNFQTSQTVSLFSIQANTTYWVKEKITSTTKTFSISTDGINYGNDITLNDNFGSGTNTTKFGTHINNLGYNFSGSIDLNRSYIKLGSTKYNLQAVVGYTVVGSPTIVDGVVSGFSSANYLQIAQSFPSVSSINKVKEWVVFTTGTIGTQQMIMGGDYGAGTFGFELRTNGKIMFRVTYTDANNTTRYAEIQSDTTLEQNTKYKAIGKFELSSLSLEFELYNENNVLLDKKTYTIQSSSFGDLLNVGNYYLGRHWQRGVFTGSIYLNETYIKINNKLWFNGQPS